MLGDALRKGTLATFSEEQLVSIIGISLEHPEDSSNPCMHWTAREVATEAVERKVVDSISIEIEGDKVPKLWGLQIEF